MDLLIRFLLNGFAVFAAAYILPGVEVDSFATALIVAVLLAVVNTFLRPVLIILTLPITIVTLGLFVLVLNSILILLVDNLVAGFSVDGMWYALLFSLVVMLFNTVLGTGEKNNEHLDED